jgi:acyl dehydratase
VSLALADELGAHPADLTHIEGRFAAPVFPGEELAVAAWTEDHAAVRFDVTAEGRPAVRGGMAVFG